MSKYIATTAGCLLSSGCYRMLSSFKRVQSKQSLDALTPIHIARGYCVLLE
ncbi:Protein of unknown function [Pyronema omphalodes CBS 100304]|uniref:Lipoprotein n=1 Tax=Pyronema omphalodes (strain CBS 100304) TaxID=1076935 RepID=U4L8E3_PYROM|nr:Protein of unknown function [Pyronema omphalodes CBS 100304]